MRLVRELLHEILASDDPSTALQNHAYAGITDANTQLAATLGFHSANGKVRDLLWKDDQLYLIHSDRLSAFDRPVGLVPYRGLMLAAITHHWHRLASKILPQPSAELIIPRAIRTERMQPFRVEVIVRGFLAGSMLRSYQAGERLFCGVQLPDNLTPFAPLPELVITPTTKAAAYVHDENTTASELIQQGVCTAEQWQVICAGALKLFALGQQTYGALGWHLVDTKYEFGLAPDDRIMVIDEIHTPDSSRLWVKDTYDSCVAAGEPPEMLDKEIVRRFLLKQGFSGQGPVPLVPAKLLVEFALKFLEVTEQLTGKPLAVDQAGALPNLDQLLTN